MFGVTPSRLMSASSERARSHGRSSSNHVGPTVGLSALLAHAEMAAVYEPTAGTTPVALILSMKPTAMSNLPAWAQAGW